MSAPEHFSELSQLRADNATLSRQLAEAREERQKFEDNWNVTVGQLQKSREIVADYRAQLAASEKDHQWQPISEAAQNGTEILGYNPEWVHEEFSPEGVRSCIYDGETWHSSTWRDDDFNILHHNAGDAPTHWMPLPQPSTLEAR